MIAVQEDALEFVRRLEGGWDCIIFDPPYLSESNIYSYKGEIHRQNENIIKKESLSRWKSALDMTYRLTISKRYLDDLEKEIIKKRAPKGFWIRFSNKRWEAEYNINWYKGRSYGGLGGYILRNTEYIMIDAWSGAKPDLKIGMFETEEHEVPKGEIALAKPVSLITKLLRFCRATKVLDPFAGSYSTYKACLRLNIEVDTCDLYVPPPIISSNELFS